MYEGGWFVLLVCILAVMSLFFSLNGLALRTFSRLKLQEACKRLGKEFLADGVTENSEKLIFTCSVLRLVCNVGILLLVVMLVSEKYYLLVFIAGALLFGIFGLAICHSWSKYAGEKILSQTYRPLLFLSRVVSPLLFILSLHDRFVHRLAGVSQPSPDREQEEILSIVEQGRMEGVVDEEEVEMIENVLELGDTSAEEIMTPRTDIIAVRVDDDLPIILETISRAGHSRIPVYEKNIDSIVGLIYAKDLLGEIGKDPKDFKVCDKMRPVYFVPETKPLRSLLHEFQNQKLHIAVVLDEYGGTAGIVTIEDILEELVGEIVDEYEKAPPSASKKLDAETVEIDARMYVDDINNEFELDLPEDEDYDTVGGFVFSHLGYIPKTGETFEYDGIKFTIASAEARRIKRLIIRKPAAEQKPEQ